MTYPPSPSQAESQQMIQHPSQESHWETGPSNQKIIRSHCLYSGMPLLGYRGYGESQTDKDYKDILAKSAIDGCLTFPAPKGDTPQREACTHLLQGTPFCWNQVNRSHLSSLLPVVGYHWKFFFTIRLILGIFLQIGKHLTHTAPEKSILYFTVTLLSPHTSLGMERDGSQMVGLTVISFYS